MLVNVIDIVFFKVALDMCLSDLESYKSGTPAFPTHPFHDDVKQVGDTLEFNGHRITACSYDKQSVKSRFLNQLINNIRQR